MITGIDVSHWQDDKSTPQKMNFAKAVKNGAQFVFIKVSERGFIDRDFEYNWKAAKDAGLLRGGYHFLRWDLSGLLQARIFCDIMADDPGELPPVADFEAPNQGSIYPSNALLEQFLMEVQTRTKKRPILYTSPGYWNIHGRNKHTKLHDDKWAYFPLWVAHYVRNFQLGVSKPDLMDPWKRLGKSWTFWQYTATGDGPAFGAESKGIDINLFNGTYDDLRKFAGLSTSSGGSTTTPPATPKPDIANLKSRVNKAIDNWAATLK
jgi:lysozyme